MKCIETDCLWITLLDFYGVLFAVFCVLALGVYWSVRTLRDYPRSNDRREFELIQVYQTLAMVGVLGWYKFVAGTTLQIWETTALIVFGWLFVFVYEFSLDRPHGMTGGPGIPFVNRERLEKIRKAWRKIR